MTSSLLSLQPFAKMKIISFSFTDESRPNLRLPLCCLVQYHPFKSILSLSKCMSRPNEAFRPADGTFKILGFSSRGYSLIYTASHIGMCQPKGYGFCAFRSKNGYTLCSFWFGIGCGFRRKKTPCKHVFVVSIPN